MAMNYCVMTREQLLSVLNDLYAAETQAQDDYWALRDAKSAGCLVDQPIIAVVIFDNNMNEAAKRLLDIQNQIKDVRMWLG